MADSESANIFKLSFTMDAKIAPQYTLILLLGNWHAGEESYYKATKMLGKFKKATCPTLDKLQNEIPVVTWELPNSASHLHIHFPVSKDLRTVPLPPKSV